MSRVLIIPNEPLPRANRPSSGPGLRALNLAAGLQLNGHDIIVAVPSVSHSSPSKATLEGQTILTNIEEVPIEFESLASFIAMRQPDVAIFTNYIQFQYITGITPPPNLGKTKIIYDFFAPRILEQAAAGQLDGNGLDSERRKKIQALRRSDAILLNGEKKLGYVAAWLALSGANLRMPMVQTPFCVPVKRSPPPGLDAQDTICDPSKDNLKLVVSGNNQSWTRSKLQVLDILPTIAKLGWSLIHIGTPRFRLLADSSTTYMPWITKSLLTSTSDLDFPSFLQLLSTADLALDIFESTREREMAYVIRTAVAMSAGLPVIHPKGTETADLIDRWGCGWTYTNENEIFSILDWIRFNPEDFKARSISARRLADSYLNPRHATAAASQLITEISSPRSRDHRKVLRADHKRASADQSDWLASLASAEWLTRRFELDYFEVANEPSPANLYLGVAEKYNYPPPNFVLEHAMKYTSDQSVKDWSLATCMRLLAMYIDSDWYGKTYGVPPDILSCSEHYFSFAGTRDLSPSPFFCEHLFLALNPPVKEAVQNRVFVNGFHYYLKHGIKQKLVASLLYDEEFYLETNPDIAVAVAEGAHEAGFEHFLQFGRLEHRSMTPIFDPGFYFAENEDLPRNWDYNKLLYHFIDDGLTEGRPGSRFHHDLVTRRLSMPQFVGLAMQARAAMSELGSAAGAADLAHRFERRLRKIKTSSDKELSVAVTWLRRLQSHRF